MVGDGAGARLPSRSREQRLRALQQANQVRSARAHLKKELAAGRLEFVQLLAEPPACLLTARVRELLLVLPGIGSVKAGRLLGQCRIAYSKTVGGLSARQRTELISRLRG